MTQQTDSLGQVSFDLSDGSYKFRADYRGYQFWSNIVDVPGVLSDVLSIPHSDVTVTVSELYNAVQTPLSNIKVYLFSSGGAYQSISATTDAQGRVTFNLPQKDYKVRADFLGGQYWSQVFNGQDASIDIAHGYAAVHITEFGTDIYDAPVYLFTGAGAYLGRVKRTDSAGMARFLVPAKAYKFRVDYNGRQYWSEAINVLPDEETTVELQLDLLALNLTNDPNPVRFNSKPPVYEPEPIRLASLIDISGILARSVVAQIPQDKIYYYINDHLGTPQKMVDESGAVVWSADYRPFGEVNVTANAVRNEFRFPGQYYDQETGLHYNYHRYYDPKMGRYLTPDPIGLDGGINLYGYVENNSVNFIDPLGLWYLDINVAGGYWVGATGGIMLNDIGIYPYAGGGAVTPGAGGSITWSPSNPTTGWNVGLQGVAAIAGQVGYGFGEDAGWFWEIGGGWTSGASLTGYYVWGPFLSPKTNSSDCETYYKIDSNTGKIKSRRTIQNGREQIYYKIPKMPQ